MVISIVVLLGFSKCVCMRAYISQCGGWIECTDGKTENIEQAKNGKCVFCACEWNQALRMLATTYTLACTKTSFHSPVFKAEKEINATEKRRNQHEE